MLDKTIAAMIFKLAVSMSGYPEPPAGFPIPDVEFLAPAALYEKACDRDKEEYDYCIAYFGHYGLIGLFDRWGLPRKVYLDKKFATGINKGEQYPVSVLLHEDVHALQLFWKHHNNPEITKEELKADEKEAYAIQRKFIGRNRTE